MAAAIGDAAVDELPRCRDRAALLDLEARLGRLPEGVLAEEIQAEIYAVGKEHGFAGIRTAAGGRTGAAVVRALWSRGEELVTELVFTLLIRRYASRAAPWSTQMRQISHNRGSRSREAIRYQNFSSGRIRREGGPALRPRRRTARPR